MIVRVLHVDAFATKPGQGNPAGVVLDADHLSDQAMQRIAARIGFNETVFVLASTKADFRFRYFTPGHEVDLCGHATVGAFIALHGRKGLSGQDNPKHLTLETGAGILPIVIEAQPGRVPIVTMNQAPAQFVKFEGSRRALAEALHISEQDIHPTLPLVYGYTGLWTLVVPIVTLETFKRMIPRTAEFPGVLVEMPTASIHPFCLETFDPDAVMHARHFSSPRSGTVEDPVTGTASGVLGAYHRKFIKPDQDDALLLVEQGQEIGRDGRVWVQAKFHDGRYQVQIKGTGCFVREFEVEAQ